MAPGTGAKRVIVFDLQAEGVSGQEVLQLPDLIEQVIKTHPGFDVVPDAEMHPALQVQVARDPGCLVKEACRSEIARTLHADLIISGAIVKKGKVYILYLALSSVTPGTAPQRTSAPMKLLTGLPGTVALCLDRLFRWPPAPASPGPVSLFPSEPVPPIAVRQAVETTKQADNPSPSPPAKKAGDKRPVLALLSVRAGAGFAPGEGESVESLLLSALEETGRFHVVGRADIQTLLDLEAKKAAVNCDESAACMTAIAGALGADLVASADIGRLGTTTVLAFRVIEVRSATVLVHAKQTVEADQDLVRAVDLIVEQTVAALAPVARGSVSVWRPVGIAATVIGLVAAAVGTGLGIAAQGQAAAAKSSPATSTPQARLIGINGMVTGSIVGWTGGGVIAATGVGLLVVF